MILEHVWKCPYCGSKLGLPDLSEFEEKLDPEFFDHAVRSSRTSRLACPRCSRTMTQLTFDDGLVVDACQTCGGAWYDRGELERALQLLDRKAVGESIFRRVQKFLIEEKEVRYLRCPHCGQLMSRQNYAKCSGVIVDRCPEHGVWLDAGELEKIHRFLNSGGAEHARRKEIQELESRKQQLENMEWFLQRGNQYRYGFWYFW